MRNAPSIKNVAAGRCPRLLLAAVLLCVSSLAQKVETDYEKSFDFSRYRRYGWGENYLLARQLPEDKDRIAKALEDSINRQMQAKGYVRDDQNPDFRIEYEAGAASADASVGVRRDSAGRVYKPGSTFSTDYPSGVPLDVWVSSLATMKLTATDVSTDKPVWQSVVSKKITDPNKLMRDLDKFIDEVTEAALKKFPRTKEK